MAENPYAKYLNAPAAPAPTPTEPREQPVEEESADVSITLGDRAVDLARGLVGGARDAIQETVDTGLIGMEVISGKVDELTGGNPEVTKQAYRDIKKRLTFSEVEQNTTTLGNITRSVTRFGLGFLGAGKVLKGVKGFQALNASSNIGGRLAAQGAQGVVGDFVVSDPHEERLADLVAEVPVIGDAVDEYLGANEKDSVAKGKLKAALEGLIVGSLVGGVVEGVVAIKAARKLRAAGKVDEAAAVIEEATPKITKPFEKAGRDGVDISINPDQVSLTHTLSEAGESRIPKGVEFKDTSLFNGERRGALINPGEEMIVARNAKGEDMGFLHVTPGADGFSVRKVEVRPEFRKQGVARSLYGESAKRYGKYLGSTDQTPEGKAMVDALKKSDPAIFGLDTPALVTKRMSDADREVFQEGLRRYVLNGTDLDLPLQGPLNYSKFDSPDSVKQLMDDLVITTRDGLKNIGGVYKPDRAKSLRLTEDMARLMGKDANDLYVSLHQAARSVEDLDSRLISGKMLIRKVSTDLEEVAKRIDSGHGSDVDKLTFTHMTDILMTTMDNVAAIQTAGARTTGAGRIRITKGINKANFADLLEKVGGDEYVRQLATRVRMADGDPAAVVAAVRGTPGTLDKITSVHNYIWMNGLLSGLKTTGINLTSNLIQTVLMPGYRIVGGAMMGNKDQIAEGVFQYQALRSTLFDSWKMTKKAWKTNQAILDPANGSAETLQRMKNPLTADYLGSWVKTANEQVEAVTGVKQGIDWLGTIIGTPGRFLNAQDEFFKQINYRANVMASARRDAFKRGINDPALVQEFMETELANAIGHMGQALDDKALLAAQQATFTQSLKAESWFNKADGTMAPTLAEGIARNAQNPIIKGTILPFVKVPTNLMRMAWDMTPGLNMLRKQFWTDMKAGGEAKAMALGKMGVGGMLWGSAALLSYEGRITGGGPRDPDLRRQLGADWQPYSFVFYNEDGTKEYISYQRLDPFGVFFGLAADFAEIGGKIDSDHLDEIATKLTLGLAKNISSKTYLRGLIDVLNTIGGDEAAGKALVRSRLASYVPGIMQVFNTDDELKDMRGVLDGVRSRIPGLSNSVESKRDNFGEKIQPPMGYPWSAINPFTYFNTKNDPVRKELADLARTDSEAQFTLPKPVIGSKENGLDLREMLDPKTGQSAYDRWLEILSKLEVGGQTLHESMGDLIKSDSYKDARKAMGNGDDLYKASLATELIQDRFDTYERVAWQQLLDERPNIREATLKLKESQAVTRVEGPQAGTPLDQLRSLAGQR